MGALLDDFASVFTEPSMLPPPRSLDHSINLVLGSGPVAVWPYCYPTAHKDELECQCATMLS